MYELLNKINGPSDLKKLMINELNILKDEIREALFNRLTKIGGHFGPNFGVVEMTIALHFVFNSPIDKFVFDVSHQSYTHKILTEEKMAISMMNASRKIRAIQILMNQSMIFLM